MPAVHVRNGGVWSRVKAMHVWTGSAWARVKRAWVWSAGSWVLAYVGTRIVSASASFISGPRNAYQATATTENAATVQWSALSSVMGTIGSGTLTVSGNSVTTPVRIGASFDESESVEFTFIPFDASGNAGEPGYAYASTPF